MGTNCGISKSWTNSKNLILGSSVEMLAWLIRVVLSYLKEVVVVATTYGNMLHTLATVEKMAMENIGRSVSKKPIPASTTTKKAVGFLTP